MSSSTPELSAATTSVAPIMSAEIQPAKTAKTAEVEAANSTNAETADAETAEPCTIQEKSSSDSKLEIVPKLNKGKQRSEPAKTAKTRQAEIRPLQHDAAAEAQVHGGITNTATAKKLASMDWVRPVLVKDDRGLNMARPINVEAILGYSRGELADTECANCANGKGPFMECVIVEGMLAGSCTNCHYNSQGKHCSFRPECKPREQSASIASSSAGFAEHANVRRRVAKRKRNSTKAKWGILLKAVEDVADAIEALMEDMED